MKLLFDQNLSFKLINSFKNTFPGTNHVRKLGLDKAVDQVIWEYAKKHSFIIVTKDSDFNERIVKNGPPPKII